MLTATSLSFGDGNEFPGGVAGIAAQEAQRRQARVKSAQTLFTAGSNAFSDRSYGEAMDYFKAAFDTIPSVPAVADQRRIFFKRYQAASLEFTRVLISEAKWAEAEATLAAVTLLAENSDVPEAIIDPEVKKILADIRSHDDRYNQAMSPQHLREAELVNSKIILGKGFLELGDYDRAERAYNEALAVDPYNTAARRGLENVERHKMNYADAAYDHTRAKMLRQVAAGWESPVPLMDTGGGEDLNVGDVAVSGSVQIEQKLKNIVIPKLEFNNARLVDVLQFLTQKSQELDTFETDPLKRGVNIVVDSAPDASGIDPSQRSLSVRISNVPLGVALQYVTGQVDMKYRVDAFAVTVVPMSSDIEGALVTRTYVVPPGFISGEGQGAGPAGPVDPFATPDEGGGGALVKRITAKDYLIKNGIEFGDGANARYIPATSKLVVRNTVDQQRSIEGLIAAVKAGGDKMVMVSVKMISIESTALNQLGMDFLLGQSNFGSTPRAFFGGGTDGNATAATSSIDYPIVGPGGSPVGMFPVTSGLRTGDVSTARTIDDIIQSGSGNPSSTKAPGIFGVAGVFTDPQFQMVLRGLSQLKASDTLCDVSVPAKPGQIAKIEQAREFIYPTEYDPPELPNQIGGVINGTSYDVNPDEIPVTPATPTAFETRRLGKVIEVEPTVSQDNHSVNVNITLDFSEFAGFINYGTPILNGNRTDLFGSALVLTPNEILMPVFDAVKETTNVDVWDGQTIAIGGLHGEGITTTNDKVPFIGDLPVLGRAFRSSTHESKKRAMLIFVTVRLVDPGGNPINDYGTEDELYSARDVPPPRSVAPVVNAPGNYVYPEK